MSSLLNSESVILPTVPSIAEDYAKYYCEDDDGNYLDVLYLREYDVDDGQLSKLYGFNIDDSNRAEYASTLSFSDSSSSFTISVNIASWNDFTLRLLLTQS